MTVYPLFGGAMYYALEKNKNGGGYIGKGVTHTDAIINCMKAMNYEAHPTAN